MAAPIELRDRPKTFDKREVLVAHPFFKGLADTIVARLASHAITRRVKKGAVLFRKGETGSQLYAVCSGAVRISVPSEQGKDAIFNLVRPGEIFGEIAFLDGGQRTADAAATEDSELMIIERRDFAPLLREHPELSARLIEILCSRLRRTSEQVEDIVFLEALEPTCEGVAATPSKLPGWHRTTGDSHHAARAQPIDRRIARKHQQATARLAAQEMAQGWTRRRDHSRTGSHERPGRRAGTLSPPSFRCSAAAGASCHSTSTLIRTSIDPVSPSRRPFKAMVKKSSPLWPTLVR